MTEVDLELTLYRTGLSEIDLPKLQSVRSFGAIENAELTSARFPSLTGALGMDFSHNPRL